MNPQWNGSLDLSHFLFSSPSGLGQSGCPLDCPWHWELVPVLKTSKHTDSENRFNLENIMTWVFLQTQIPHVSSTHSCPQLSHLASQDSGLDISHGLAARAKWNCHQGKWILPKFSCKLCIILKWKIWAVGQMTNLRSAEFWDLRAGGFLFWISHHKQIIISDSRDLGSTCQAVVDVIALDTLSVAVVNPEIIQFLCSRYTLCNLG